MPNRVETRTAVEAIKALATFGVNGYGEEAAKVILEIVRGYEWNSKHNSEYTCMNAQPESPPEARVMWEAQQAIRKINFAAVRLLPESLANPKTRVFTELTMRWMRLPKTAIPTLVEFVLTGKKRDRILRFLLGKNGYVKGLTMVWRPP